MVSFCLTLKDDNFRFEVRWLDICDQPPLKTRVQTLFDLRYISGRAVGGEDYLLLPIVKRIKCVKELLLGSFLARNELHVIYQEHINAAIAFAKSVGLVVAK